MTRIIALANQKGGVGKTTTTQNLGAALAERGRRVLLIDLDPQSNLTIGWGINPNEQHLTAYEVLLNPEQGAGIAVQNVRPQLDLIPATLDMAAAELELAGRIGRETLLRKALAPIRSHYDYILIDPPPSLGLFTLNALAAATEVLIPLQTEVYALKGMAQLQRTIALMQEMNSVLKIGGILCTMTDRRQRMVQSIEEHVRELYGDLVYTTIIPENVKLKEAPVVGQPVLETDPHSIGALAYRELAVEVDQ